MCDMLCVMYIVVVCWYRKRLKDCDILIQICFYIYFLIMKFNYHCMCLLFCVHKQTQMQI